MEEQRRRRRRACCADRDQREIANLAALGLLSSIAAWLAGATFWWLVAGALLGSVIPFALFVILPTNKLLLSPTLDRRSAQAGQLLARWGVLR